MTPAAIIAQARAEGVELKLSATGVKAVGPTDAVTRWLPVLRAHKAELTATLQAPRRATAAEAEELRRLVRTVGTFYAFSADEHVLALGIAVGDPDAALICFRDIAARIGSGW